MNRIAPSLARPLRRKLLVPFMLIGVAVAATAVWGIHATAEQQLVEKLRQRAEFVADAVNYAAENISQQNDLQRIVSATGAENEVTLIVVVGGSPTRVLAATRNAWVGKTLAELPSEALADDLENAIRARRSHYHFDAERAELEFNTPLLLSHRNYARSSLNAGAVKVRMDVRPTYHEIQTSSVKFAAAFLAVLTGLTIIAYRLLNRHVLRPLAAIGDYLAHREDGTGGQFLARAGTDSEVGALAHTLSEALNRADSAVAELEEQKIALMRSQRQLTEAQRIAQLGSWDWDVVNGTMICSEEEFRLFGRRPEDCTPTVDFHLASVHPEDRQSAVEAISTVLSTKKAMSMNARIIRADGEERILHRRMDVLLNEAGEVTHMVGTSQDITERKRIEAEVHLAKEAADAANRAKSDFLSRMSHELRTPLNAILGFGQLLEMESPTPEQAESVEQIVKAGKHLLSLVNEVLDIARVESGHMSLSPEPVRAAELLQECADLIRPMAAARGIRIESLDLERCHVHVRADRSRLRQVLLNFLSNAVKYNRPEGTVTLRCEACAVQGHVRFEVRDTGYGIAPSDLSRLFTPFERLGASETIEGTGLGLALSKRLVELMGGTIGAESKVGNGSTFWICLPLTQSPDRALTNARPALMTKASAVVGTVLYIEDNLSNLTLVERIFAYRPDLRLISAMQGQLGFDLARQHAPHLILLDLNLPDMHGHEVLRRLRGLESTQDIPVVVITADATPGQRGRTLAAGASGFVSKPLVISDFLKAIDELLTRRSKETLPDADGLHSPQPGAGDDHFAPAR